MLLKQNGNFEISFNTLFQIFNTLEILHFTIKTTCLSYVVREFFDFEINHYDHHSVINLNYYKCSYHLAFITKIATVCLLITAPWWR